jgi:hypothetical protein
MPEEPQELEPPIVTNTRVASMIRAYSRGDGPGFLALFTEMEEGGPGAIGATIGAQVRLASFLLARLTDDPDTFLDEFMLGMEWADAERQSDEGEANGGE